jgi:nucleotide-binding universal stress UspA family protein
MTQSSLPVEERATKREIAALGRDLSPGTERGRFRHILVCLDGSPLSDRLLSHAAAMVRTGPRRITLMRVLEPTGHRPQDPLDWEVSRAEAESYLRNAAQRLGTLMPIEVETAEGSAPEEICLFAQQRDVDLIVLSTHGERGPSPWPLASTARKLVGMIPASLLLVPAGAPLLGPEHEPRYRRIALALDGSPRSESALPVAMRIARVHEAELLLAHVAERARLTRVGPCSGEDLDLEARFGRRSQQLGELYLNRLRARICDRGVKVRIALESGHDVAAAISSVLDRERVSLAMLTAHGEGATPLRPFGPVALQVLESADLPVLLMTGPGGSGARFPLEAPASPRTRSPSAEA